MAASQPFLSAVRDALAAAGDPVRARGAQAYMKSSMPFHGVRVPQVRGIVRAALAAHPLPDRRTWQDTLLELWDGAGHREERYAAVALVRAVTEGRRGGTRPRVDLDLDLLELCGHLVVTGAWWDLVDELAAHAVGPVLRAVGPPAAAVLRTWVRDEDLWLRRAAVLAQLGARGRTDTALLADCLDAVLDEREFFLRKAVGWALRDYARTDPAWVAAFVAGAGERLSPLSRREATRHLDGPRAGLRGAPVGGGG